jgi:uridine phosphorylase
MTLFRAIAAVITLLSERPYACLTTQTIPNNEFYNTKVQKQWTHNRNTVQKWKKWQQFLPNFEMSQHLQRKYVKRYKIRVLEERRQSARQNEGPLSGTEQARRWR